MPTLTITVVMTTEDTFEDDLMSVLENQVAEALGGLGDVETVDIEIDEADTFTDDDLELDEDE